MSRAVPTAGPQDLASRIERDEAALARYREERDEHAARGTRARTADRVIRRLEAEIGLLRSWSAVDAAVAPAP